MRLQLQDEFRVVVLYSIDCYVHFWYSSGLYHSFMTSIITSVMSFQNDIFPASVVSHLLDSSRFIVFLCPVLSWHWYWIICMLSLVR